MDSLAANFFLLNCAAKNPSIFISLPSDSEYGVLRSQITNAGIFSPTEEIDENNNTF